MCTRAIDYTFQEAQTGKKEGTETDGLEQDGPFSVSCVGWCLCMEDFENGSGEADDAEYEEVDPAELFLESVAEEDDECEEEDGDVDYEFGYCNRIVFSHFD